MSNPAKKPNAIIFGGLNTCSRALAALLVPLDGERLVSVLAKPKVEYKQVNLTVAAAVASSFDPPEGHDTYDYVFDFTGEIRHDRTEMIQINTTFNVARLIGLEAAKRKIKSYVRVQQPFYDTSNASKATHTEKEDVKPMDTLGIWWHETLRMLAAIEDLNLVILRIGFAYGPYTNHGIVASGITVASVYGYLKKPMKSVWSPGKNANNTVHIDDVAGASLACAEWIASYGRAAANSVAGEEIIFHNDKKKVKEVKGMPAHDQKLVAPLFNLLMDDNVEDINEHHVGGWTEMILASKPPIPNTPLSAYMDKFALSKHVVAFNNAKVKEVVGYKLKHPEFNHETIKEVVDKWKEEGTWPILD
ncbi:hypothetical protein DXG03_005032 [Asterophora parasitica]|uniref:NAD-dependent epimerase/dehydratase domain-containing protein n=1 Tax=Asterophora parasitica TaxID=117018 RepID=A0A9P7KEG5_9AGAR|nr:hypothetical protein DXG03_005032 [Asterophora parasitica]